MVAAPTVRVRLAGSWALALVVALLAVFLPVQPAEAAQEDLSGTVTLPDNGAGVAEAQVQLERIEAWGGVNPVALTTTDQAGAYRFAAGTFENDSNYRVRAVPPSTDTQHAHSRNASVSVDSNGALFVDGVQKSTLALELQVPNYTGTVRYPSDGSTRAGQAVADAPIRVLDGDDPVVNVSTGGDGSFRLALDFASSGPFEVVADSPSPEYLPSEPQQADAAASDVSIFLTVPNITGTVTDPDGQPRTTAWVELMGYEENGQYWSHVAFAHVDGFGDYQVFAPAETNGTKAYRLVAKDNDLPGSDPVEVLVDTDGSVSTDDGASFVAQATVDLQLNSPNVTGTVYAPAGGGPVAQAHIEVMLGDQHHDGANTKSDGTYSLRLAPANSGETTRTYRLRAIPWNDPNVFPSAWTEVEVDESGNVVGTNTTSASVILDLELREPNVTGTVLGPDETSYAGAEVDVRTADQWFEGASSGQDGSYGLLLQAPDSGTRVYEVHARVWDDPSVVASKVVEITVNAAGEVSRDGATFASSLAGVDLTLREPNVTGVVMDPDGNRVAEAEVQLRTGDYSFSDWGRAGADGAFGFYVEAAGQYVLSASPSWGSTDPVGDSAEVEVTVELVDGRPTVTSPNPPIELRLRAANVSGTVEDPYGQPVENSSVQIRSEDHSFWDWAHTDQNGDFRLALAPGRYVFVAEPAWNSTDLGRSEEVTVEVTESGMVPDPLVLALTTPNVTGSVVDPSGQPLSDATHVELRSADYGFYSHVNTDQSGAFAVTLADGEYFARANPPWASTDTASVETRLVVSGGDLTHVGQGPFHPDSNPLRLQLTRPAVEGTACAPGMNAIAEDCGGDDELVGHGWAVLHTADWDVQIGTSIDADGRYAFGGVPSGTYLLDVFPPWERSELMPVTDQEVTVTDGQEQNRNTVYELADKTIAVTVLDADGTTITTDSFRVYAFDRDSSFAEDRDGPNPSGVYEIPVAAGTWDVMVQADSSDSAYVYNGQHKTVTVGDSSTASVTFTAVKADAVVQGSVVDASGKPLTRWTQNSAWIEVRSSDGRGNGGELQDCDGSIDGTSSANKNCFQVRVPAGTYKLYVHPFNSDHGAPEARTVTVGSDEVLTVDGDPETIGADAVRLLDRDARIQGRVAYRSGTTLSGVDVFAWQPNGGGYANAVTGSDGTYTLKVAAGEWEVGIWPGPDDTWLYDGEAQRVSVQSGEIASGANFSVTASAATIEGRLVRPDGTTARADAYVWLRNVDGGHGHGGSVTKGTFSVPVRPGQYELQVFLAPGSDLAAPEPVTLSVAAGGTILPPDGMTMPLELELVQPDRTVTGVVVDEHGAAVTGDLSESFVVTASKDTGEHVDTEIVHDGQQNSYTLELPAGIWNIGFFAISESGYARLGVEPSRTVDLNSASSAVRDLRVVAADQPITGTVVDSQDRPIPFAWVSADATSDSAFPSVHRSVSADANGEFTLLVPEGTYLVGAAAEVPEHQRPKRVAVDTSAPEPVTLKFLELRSTISGTVRHDGDPKRAKVDAWSDGGGYASTTAGADGSYTLGVTGDDVWHVSAVDPNGGTATTVLVTGEVDVPLGTDESAAGVELTLMPKAVPSATTRQFDAASSQVLTIGDVTLTVPAGALDTSGQVSIIARPNAKPGTTADTKPVGLGYVFEAFDLTDADGNSQQAELSGNFNKSLRIKFGYDLQELESLGLAPEDLLPAYWDETTSSYRRIENATVDEANETITFSVDHFTDFVIASTDSSGPDDTDSGDGGSDGGGSGSGGTGGGSDGGSADGGTTSPGSDGPGADDGATSDEPQPEDGQYSSVRGTLEPGGTLSTDTDADGATTATPVQVSLTSPQGGEASIVTSRVSGTRSGYRLVGAEADISAPVGTREEPIRLVFTVDGSLVRPDDPLAVFRNGSAVPACEEDGAEIASPDPCVAERAAADGDVVLTVLTSRASVWHLGVVDTDSLEIACPASETPSGGFSDVPQEHAHAPGIDCVAAWGVTRGTGDDTFSPGRVVTRAQMASFLVRLLVAADVELPTDPENPFTDIDGNTHRDPIVQLAALGVVQGTTATTFSPDGGISRAQMASLMVRAFEFVTERSMGRGDASFDDVEAGSTHAEAIAKIARIGFAKGSTSSTFEPGSSVSRGQMATFLGRMLNRLSAEGKVEMAR